MVVVSLRFLGPHAIGSCEEQAVVSQIMHPVGIRQFGYRDPTHRIHENENIRMIDIIFLYRAVEFCRIVRIDNLHLPPGCGGEVLKVGIRKDTVPYKWPGQAQHFVGHLIKDMQTVETSE